MCIVCVVNVRVWVGGICLQTGLCVSVCIFCEFLCLCACRRERDARKGEREGCSWGDKKQTKKILKFTSNYSKLLAAWWGSSSTGRVKDWEIYELKCLTHTISTSPHLHHLHISTISIISIISRQSIVHLCRLHIYSLSPSGVETRITPSTGLYGVLERPFLIYNTAGVIVPDFRSAGSRMRLDYQGKPTVIYRGFRLLITAFHGRGFLTFFPYFINVDIISEDVYPGFVSSFRCLNTARDSDCFELSEGEVVVNLLLHVFLQN